MKKHWNVFYDPSDGEEIADVCECEIGKDHNAYGEEIEDE